MDSIINWLERNMSPCFYKKYFGMECPGCGMQRSIIALLKGNFIDSFFLYPGLFPTIILIVFSVFHIIFKFKNGADIIKWLFFFNLTVVLGNFIIKTFTGSCSHC